MTTLAILFLMVSIFLGGKEAMHKIFDESDRFPWQQIGAIWL